MKKVFYFIYAVIFNFFSVLPLKKNKVVFLSPHNENFNDSLGAVMEEVIRRDEFRVVLISGRDLKLDTSNVKKIFSSIGRAISFFTVKAYHLATAHYIFLNDNFMPMGKLRFKKNAVITQLWHAEGAFKKFGLDIEQPDDVRELEKKGNAKLTYVVCSSEEVAPIYANAFGVSDYKVLPLGSARLDWFGKEINTDRLRADFDKKYPMCKGKQLALYAPTFRDNTADDERILDNFDVAAFNERFGDKYALLIRLHPQVHSNVRIPDGAVDVCDYENVTELMRLCDFLITDYSSICMDFAVQDKPVYFYAFDLDRYERDRSFYFDYESYVPGPVAKDFQTLLNLINSTVSETYRMRRYDFNYSNFGTPDGKAAERIVDRIIYNK
ncbi:MAG: CDP-glycerol glycerophosphotransferase family protein [Acutalibacteraceae bacterium]